MYYLVLRYKKIGFDRFFNCANKIFKIIRSSFYSLIQCIFYAVRHLIKQRQMLIYSHEHFLPNCFSFIHTCQHPSCRSPLLPPSLPPFGFSLAMASLHYLHHRAISRPLNYVHTVSKWACRATVFDFFTDPLHVCSRFSPHVLSLGRRVRLDAWIKSDGEEVDLRVLFMYSM